MKWTAAVLISIMLISTNSYAANSCPEVFPQAIARTSSFQQAVNFLRRQGQRLVNLPTKLKLQSDLQDVDAQIEWLKKTIASLKNVDKTEKWVRPSVAFGLDHARSQFYHNDMVKGVSQTLNHYIHLLSSEDFTIYAVRAMVTADGSGLSNSNTHLVDLAEQIRRISHRKVLTDQQVERIRVAATDRIGPIFWNAKDKSGMLQVVAKPYGAQESLSDFEELLVDYQSRRSALKLQLAHLNP